MQRPLIIWCNAHFHPSEAESLKKGVGRHTLVFDSNLGGILSTGGQSEQLISADVAFGQPDPAQCVDSRRLRWIQITSAGYTRYDTGKFRDAVAEKKIAFCNASSIYDDPCAQHVLAFMLADARQLPQAVREQITSQSWEFAQLRPATRILSGDRVLIVGYGAIGKRLIDLLAPFGLDVVALRRAPRGDEPVPCFGIDRLAEELGKADHVVNLVPANEANHHLFGPEEFKAMKTGSRFYNVGRGTTVDQDALIEALESGRLACAMLDVADPEPLPRDHPLWKAPNLTLTPHIAGGFDRADQKLVELFLENLRKFESGEPLRDRVF
jgi:phosphoglycerate dehydrogenase-like enzyme